MRLRFAALGSVVAALLMGVAFLPVLSGPELTRWLVPAITSALVLIMSFGAPRIIDPHYRPWYSLMVAVPGLVTIWIMALLPETFSFPGSTAGSRPDLWLAAAASSAALGMILMFVVQLVSGPKQTNRLAQLCLSAVVMAVGVAASGWAVVARDMYEPIMNYFGYPGDIDTVTQSGGLGWLSITVLAGIIVATLVGLIPWGKIIPTTLGFLAGTMTTIALQLVAPQALSLSAVAASSIGSMMILLVYQLVRTQTDPEALAVRERKPTPAIVGVSLGMAPVLATGMAFYFTLWLLPTTF